MISTKEILVTTTSSVEGINVKQYLKPVSAHVVAGTNFFSDFFASFSDVFGGRSQTYQRQLSSLYNEAIDLLKCSAYEVGANCILGLRVDLDEISGKGKSMFMITATGTAVKIETTGKAQSKSSQNEKIDILSSDKMIELRKRKKIIKQAQEKTIVLDETTWDFLTANSVFEVAKEILEIAHEKYVSLYEGKEKLYQQLSTYLLSIQENIRTNLLYDYLMNEKSQNFTSVLFSLIRELMIFDYSRLQELLKSENTLIKSNALQICTIEKAYYSKEDIKSYENLINIISTSFPKIGEVTTQKKLLSSKEKEIWICQCGSKNNIDIYYCSTCNKDIYGYLSNEFNPETAIAKINETIELIKINVA